MGNPVIMILGPSGVGKSTVGQWLGVDLGLLHLEADLDPKEGNGIDVANIRPEWNRFYFSREAGPIVETLRSRSSQAGRRGTVLTLPGNVELQAPTIIAAEDLGATVLVLFA